MITMPTIQPLVHHATFVLFDPGEVTRVSWSLLLKKLFPQCVTIEAADPEETQHALARCRDALVMMKFRPSGMEHGLEPLKAVLAHIDGSRVVVICGAPANVAVRTAMQAGASVFIRDDESVEELERAIHAALEGVPHMSGELATAMACTMMTDDEDSPLPLQSLSIREEEVLNMLVSGLRPTQVAGRLGLSVKTISSHKRNALGKLGAASILEAARLWL
jgi:two-component system capsular synthesis response regulator RcsB